MQILKCSTVAFPVKMGESVAKKREKYILAFKNIYFLK